MIGFVDGVNPCSLWVISVLLTIVVRTASRRRVLAIGSTFLVGDGRDVRAVHGRHLLGADGRGPSWAGSRWSSPSPPGSSGSVSVKDYFAFKKGLSFTITDSAKPGIYKRMRAAAGHERCCRRSRRR